MGSNDTVMYPYKTQFKLFERIRTISDAKQLELLRYLHRGRLDKEVYKLIVDLSADQQHRLFNQLVQMTHRDRPEKTIDLDERQATRKKCALSADFQDGGQIRKGQIRDISTLGVFIETPHSMEIGQKLSMRFTFPKAENPLKIRGEIVRKDTNGIGVKFDPLAQQEIDLIDIFVRKF